MKPFPNTVEAIVLDFDNTLYDWVDQWYRSFSALLMELERISGVAEEKLKSEIRSVHQRHHTSEYAFLIQEIPSLREDNLDELLKKYEPALDSHRRARSAALRLYPGVLDVLTALKSSGITTAIFTESQSFYTQMRFKKFGLDGLVDFLFTADDHALPDDVDLRLIRRHPSSHYELNETRSRSVGRKLKPNPAILAEIIAEIGANPERVIYIGDSKFKDVAMAQQAGVFGIWAKYGYPLSHPGYELLREVSHWTDADVQREKDLHAVEVEPDLIFDRDLTQLTELLAR